MELAHGFVRADDCENRPRSGGTDKCRLTWHLARHLRLQDDSSRGALQRSTLTAPQGGRSGWRCRDLAQAKYIYVRVPILRRSSAILHPWMYATTHAENARFSIVHQRLWNRQPSGRPPPPGRLTPDRLNTPFIPPPHCCTHPHPNFPSHRPPTALPPSPTPP